MISKALVAFIQFARWAGLMDEQPELSSTESISAEDEAILAGYLERHGLKPQNGENPPAEAEDSRPTRQQRRKSPEDKT